MNFFVKNHRDIWNCFFQILAGCKSINEYRIVESTIVQCFKTVKLLNKIQIFEDPKWSLDFELDTK